ncbi:hypothetical protein [Streptomyces sp. NBC_01320]|uniref:hypothetical protein n=1 Tax=Streptomyces sp. NBC_01320 TaxID=2903824 RepID=UPI002E11BC1E|nr:hypothetical protein OG395_57040 [Streptomyces sp. NBC_01320]
MVRVSSTVALIRGSKPRLVQAAVKRSRKLNTPPSRAAKKSERVTARLIVRRGRDLAEPVVMGEQGASWIRVGRGLRLTPTGQALVRHADTIFSARRAAHQDIALVPVFPLGLQSRFRVEFHECLYARADVLFELTDAVLCTDGPVRRRRTRPP